MFGKQSSGELMLAAHKKSGMVGKQSESKNTSNVQSKALIEPRRAGDDPGWGYLVKVDGPGAAVSLRQPATGGFNSTMPRLQSLTGKERDTML